MECFLSLEFPFHNITQEWRNAVALFVNVVPTKGGAAAYDNMFLHGGHAITWFGSSKHHWDTPVVQRMLAAPRAGFPAGLACA